MRSFIQSIILRLKTPKPRIWIRAEVWNSLFLDLRKSSAGRRESGAFLLGCDGKIESYELYEKLGEDSLYRGAIRLDGKHFGRLWKICREQSLQLVADVHTHPGSEFQSDIDKANPLWPERGHVGLIIPFYATGNSNPSNVGVYQYLGQGHWRTISKRSRHRVLILTGGQNAKEN